MHNIVFKCSISFSLTNIFTTRSSYTPHRCGWRSTTFANHTGTALSGWYAYSEDSVLAHKLVQRTGKKPSTRGALCFDTENLSPISRFALLPGFCELAHCIVTQRVPLAELQRHGSDGGKVICFLRHHQRVMNIRREFSAEREGARYGGLCAVAKTWWQQHANSDFAQVS